MNQEHLSDEQVNMLIHTPLSAGSPIVPTIMSNSVRITRASEEKDETTYG
jgi:hypothetical protein